MSLSSGRQAVQLVMLLLLAFAIAGCMPQQLAVAQEMVCELFEEYAWGDLNLTSTPQIISVDEITAQVELLGWQNDEAHLRRPVWLSIDVAAGDPRPWAANQIPTSYRDVCVNCHTAVFATSPQQKWQLVQTTGPKHGIWLVSRKQSIPLLSYIPRQDHWAWTTDEGTLLYTYSLPRTGTSFAIVHLDEAFPRIVYFEDLIQQENSLVGDSSYIDPFHHTLAFEANTGVIWATRQGFPTAGKIYQYNAHSHALVNSWESPRILKTAWHPALQTIMQFSYDTAGLHIEAANGRVRAHVPRRALEQLYKKPADTIYTHHLTQLHPLVLPRTNQLLWLDEENFFTAVCASDYHE